MQLGNRDFSKPHQGLFADSYPDWVIQQNLTFRQATHPETIAIFQLIRGGTRSLFCNGHGQLAIIVRPRYVTRISEMQHLIRHVQSKVQLSTDL